MFPRNIDHMKIDNFVLSFSVLHLLLAMQPVGFLGARMEHLEDMVSKYA
jgi:hypothetical protein